MPEMPAPEFNVLRTKQQLGYKFGCRLSQAPLGPVIIEAGW